MNDTEFITDRRKTLSRVFYIDYFPNLYDLPVGEYSEDIYSITNGDEYFSNESSGIVNLGDNCFKFVTCHNYLRIIRKGDKLYDTYQKLAGVANYYILVLSNIDKLSSITTSIFESNEDNCAKFFVQIGLAIYYLHLNNIYHRNIYLYNILRDTNSNFILTGFDLSCMYTCLYKTFNSNYYPEEYRKDEFKYFKHGEIVKPGYYKYQDIYQLFKTFIYIYGDNEKINLLYDIIDFYYYIDYNYNLSAKVNLLNDEMLMNMIIVISRVYGIDISKQIEYFNTNYETKIDKNQQIIYLYDKNIKIFGVDYELVKSSKNKYVIKDILNNLFDLKFNTSNLLSYVRNVNKLSKIVPISNILYYSLYDNFILTDHEDLVELKDKAKTYDDMYNIIVKLFIYLDKLHSEDYILVGNLEDIIKYNNATDNLIFINTHHIVKCSNTKPSKCYPRNKNFLKFLKDNNLSQKNMKECSCYKSYDIYRALVLVYFINNRNIKLPSVNNFIVKIVRGESDTDLRNLRELGYAIFTK